ncbi:la-related 6A [Olea europaea subsp. europaea]|uniref:La-related 6A n=1 Tax=Olea europaea subsp. europaea TaxID=158383 RepID=A0A8S0U7E2_OLEEU|nr:la-related 6A [Olea europaea subsp. europaea]
MEHALIPTSSSPPSDHDHDPDPSDHDHDHDHEPDYSPVGSPELAESYFPQAPDLPQAAVLSDDLRNKIIKQVEYYFSDENLPNDKFLMKYVTKNAEGFVPVGVIASFRKMKKLTRDVSLIVAALRESEHLVVSSNGKMVKRLHPLPLAEVKDPMLHALVEYDTVEAAEKAVVTLNNEQDWRFGLRVKLLKKTNKPGQKKKNWRESEPEKSNNTQVSDPVGNEENLYSSRNRGRGRRQKLYGTNGHGHGTHASGHGIEPLKPPPGPRMPDGTRGFTMGRGRPLASN